LRAANGLLRSIALGFERHTDPAALHLQTRSAGHLPALVPAVHRRVLGNPARAALVPRSCRPAP